VGWGHQLLLPFLVLLVPFSRREGGGKSAQAFPSSAFLGSAGFPPPTRKGGPRRVFSVFFSSSLFCSRRQPRRPLILLWEGNPLASGKGGRKRRMWPDGPSVPGVPVVRRPERSDTHPLARASVHWRRGARPASKTVSVPFLQNFPSKGKKGKERLVARSLPPDFKLPNGV